jgi:hypothetical protein
MTQPTEYEQVTYNSPDGAQMGKTSTEKIGFYGATPQAIYTLVGAASTYNTTSLTTSTCGFSDMASLTSFIYQVSTITVALKNLGLIG